VLLSFRFLGTASVGSLAMALVSIFAPPPAQLAALGACVSVLAGLFVAYLEQEAERERRRSALLEGLRVPMALAPDHDLFDLYRSFSASLTELALQLDPALRRFAVLKLTSLSAEVHSLAHGTIVFHGTETWRTVYEELLSSPGIGSYLSVSWVKTPDYWQDRPGWRSMQLNFALAERGLRIERILILRDELWPADEPLPSDAIRGWIDEQHAHGIRVSLLRESEIASEPDLLVDFGIYGERATGTHELDECARTVRFIVQFEPQALQLARDRWSRAALYATSYAELLDTAVVAA
jgi:hypothetical protein